MKEGNNVTFNLRIDPQVYNCHIKRMTLWFNSCQEIQSVPFTIIWGRVQSCRVAITIITTVQTLVPPLSIKMVNFFLPVKLIY